VASKVAHWTPGLKALEQQIAARLGA
jgi:hypothetical protein